MRQDMTPYYPPQQPNYPLPQQYVPPPQNPYQQAMPSEAPEASLIKPILQNWWLVALFMLIGIGGAVVYIKKTKPLYNSVAKLNIPPTSAAVADVIGGTERTNFLATQASIMTSTTILDPVAKRADMQGLKTFETVNGNALYWLRENVNVEVERKTDLIDISVDSPYPDEAAIIVNAVADEYQTYCYSEKNTTKNGVLDTLKSRQEQQDKLVADKEAAVRAFRIANPGISPTDGSASEMTEMSQVSQTLTQKQMQLIDARSRLGADHPTLVGLQKQVQDIQRLYDEKMDHVTKSKSKGQQLAALLQDLDNQKAFSKELGDRIHQIDLATTTNKLVNVDIAEPGRAADAPSSPRKHRALAIAAVLGALLGCGLALLRDKLDGRMKSVEDIQASIGLPILGVVPAMTGRRTAVARAMTVHLDPRSVVAEAYRTIRTAVYFSTANARCKTLLLTSPEPGDGKTTSASNLAIAIAQTGRSVLLLDADFRKPSQHKNLDIKDAIGLSSVLAGRETLENAIQKTGVEGLDILPCGPIPANPSEILNSREFAELIDLMAERYDHIVFDSPPVNRVTDAQILAAVCDATILVLRADKSTKKAGEHARNQLLAVGARLIGAIVNDAPKKKGYGVYGGSYYGSVDPGATITPSPRRLTAANHRMPNTPRRDAI